MKETFYITTPIYYPSRKFTLGNCYTTVICDAVARFNKLLDKDVFFMTGTDEHGQKIAQAAKNANKTEMEYLDEIIADAKNLWSMLKIDYDKFIRTTDDYHVSSVQKIFRKLYDKGYIYKSAYKGKYCVPCESFWTESQLVDGKCPDCKRDVIDQEEESYFFKLSEFSDKLLDLYKNNPNFLQPQSRVNEMINNFIKPGLEDLCVTRTSVKWGVPVDFDPKHTIYVWIDALSNYITGLGYGSDDETMFNKFWPADVHVIGKEIVRFHAIIWPALLMALDIPVPKRVFGHGWLLFGGDKLSKSKSVMSTECVDPRILAPRYTADAVRYILLSEIPFGSDGNYSTELFLNTINSDLANNYGNLVSRTFSMLKKYCASIVPEYDENASEDIDEDLKKSVLQLVYETKKHMETNFDVSKALDSIFEIFSKANKYIEVTEPYKLAKDEANKARLNTVMRNLLECIRIGTILLSAYLPDCSARVIDALSLADVSFKNVKEFYKLEAGLEVKELGILFPRLDVQKELEELAKLEENKQ
ncbi:MAG: methionine--tRNA ligase [Clostridia bacterium]|nr:methionine--tRNA ligase [Clostridia bacterium]